MIEWMYNEPLVSKQGIVHKTSVRCTTYSLEKNKLLASWRLISLVKRPTQARGINTRVTGWPFRGRGEKRVRKRGTRHTIAKETKPTGSRT